MNHFISLSECNTADRGVVGVLNCQAISVEAVREWPGLSDHCRVKVSGEWFPVKHSMIDVLSRVNRAIDAETMAGAPVDPDSQARSTSGQPIAHVICTIGDHRGQLGTVYAEMSTDLPAADMGELCAEAVNEAYSIGLDPVTDGLVLTFRFK
jgi:hypothetical protein